MPAPKNPWIARQTIICSIEEANPHTKLEMVKPAAEIAASAKPAYEAELAIMEADMLENADREV